MWHTADRNRQSLLSENQDTDYLDDQHDSSNASTSTIDDDIPSSSERAVPSVDSFPDVAGYGPHWAAKRHLTCGNPSSGQTNTTHMSSWRLKDKLKTTNAALVVCLNIDVDPPDVVKTNPCAVLECWVDPHSLPSNKALEAIGNNLHHQFEVLSPRIKFKPYLDPSYEDTKKFCINLRKMAKEERCLFYYNGHGVPKPTPSGELWVFNKSYSQYIPVSLAEIQTWLGSPCIYIWDCSAAGNLLNNFIHFAERRDADMKLTNGGYPEGMQPFMESIQLAACLANEQLPMCPSLPADLFTSCLTSPIDLALRWHMITHHLPNNVNVDMVQKLPGDLRDRRTPLGELNWIFTAITDTIAWTTFSRETFIRLYRSDLLVASLFRNFLLAERVMKNYHCTPHTYPALPPTNTHPMWASWDLAVHDCLSQLPDLLRHEKKETVTEGQSALTKMALKGSDKPYVYIPSRFFADHLTAFDVWLSRGGSALTKRGPGSLWPAALDGSDMAYNGHDGGWNAPNSTFGRNSEQLVPRKPPDQLPIVLQVLLSQPHRLRALILLSQFVDLGPWAVHLALTIGIFPFISKLLQAPAPELRPVLIFIWARILAVDPSCQMDLYSNQGYKYFANVLSSQEDRTVTIPNSSEHISMCCFILSAVCRGFPAGQTVCWHEHVFDNCFDRLEDDDFLLRQWMALCIGQMWDGNDDIKIYGVDHGTQDKLIGLLSDNSPEVRTAALFALGTFLGASGSLDSSKKGGGGTGSMYHLDERTHFRLEVAVATGAALATKEDASPMVRKELLILLSCLVKEWRGYFVVVAWLYWEDERRRSTGEHAKYLPEDDHTHQAISEWLDGFGDDEAFREESRVLLSSFYTLNVILLELAVDTYPEVAAFAQTLVDYIMALLLESPFTHLECATLDSPPPQIGVEPRSRVASLQTSARPTFAPPLRAPIARSDSTNSSGSSGGTNILRRTASFANSLRNIAGTYAFPSLANDDGNLSPNSFQGPRHHPDSSNLSSPPSPNLSSAEYTPPHYLGASSDSSSDRQHSMDYLPSDVMEALIEEDMERLRARRRKKTQQRHYQQYVAEGLPSPSGSTFSHDSAGSVLLGLGTGTGVRDALPLKSRFYDWCCEYFTETQMRQPESEEPGSVQYNEQMWRRQRNERVVGETQAQAEVASYCPWDRPVATLQHGGYPLKMAFHAYDPYLFVANEANMISVFDWTRRKRLVVFNNGNPQGTSITSLHCINQDVGGIIMSASSDGIVNLFRNYDAAYTEQPLQMVTSFRALGAILSMKRGSGVILDWQQGPGVVLAGGDSRIIRAWDAHRECALTDLSTHSESPVTAICSDHESTSVFLAGFGDGVVKLFDRRMDEDDAVVRTYQEHSTWVQNIRWQKGTGKSLLSASLDGEVRLWDVRSSNESVHKWTHPEGLSAFDAHEQAAVFATTSALTSSRWRQLTVTVHSLHPSKPSRLSRILLPSGLHHNPTHDMPSPYIPSHTSLTFHPHEMLYGIGGADGVIRLMGCKFTEKPSTLHEHAVGNSHNGPLPSVRSISP
ncbi:hypothetical protein BD410DRAFT_780006 [Rickenella mellea]|uniref:Raptor N-terminal CASPase-like domain-containing protein n=1 Tax=Rickenella mellea TaxID=50990 RepID=A0A4R5XET7_9AGAM|nr:hypothetical protein BD410DRAFT_780006 [Rickenella mellea]